MANEIPQDVLNVLNKVFAHDPETGSVPEQALTRFRLTYETVGIMPETLLWFAEIHREWKQNNDLIEVLDGVISYRTNEEYSGFEEFAKAHKIPKKYWSK